ncbi:hypothetical protein J19TS2_21690 [Cohnella xylanilytica]|nr:hypothetical protein J19TS2_21690 [Cohnella xylanilytica]
MTIGSPFPPWKPTVPLSIRRGSGSPFASRLGSGSGGSELVDCEAEADGAGVALTDADAVEDGAAGKDADEVGDAGSDAEADAGADTDADTDAVPLGSPAEEAGVFSPHAVRLTKIAAARIGATIRLFMRYLRLSGSLDSPIITQFRNGRSCPWGYFLI